MKKKNFLSPTFSFGFIFKEKIICLFEVCVYSLER